MSTGWSIHNASYLRYTALNHRQKVKSLYKRCLENLRDHAFPDRPKWRYEAVLCRQQFEEHRNEKDMRKVKMMMAETEHQLFLKRHPQPLYYTFSPNGIYFERELDSPDLMLDWWHPLEKAAYPHYFARREQRKQEYLKRWQAKYATDPEKDLGITGYSPFGDVKIPLAEHGGPSPGVGETKDAFEPEFGLFLNDYNSAAMSEPTEMEIEAAAASDKKV